jgi:hypothetical protein
MEELELNEEIGNIDVDMTNIDELEVSPDEMKSYFDGDLGDNFNPNERRRKDPTREEMKEYFELVKEKVKSININMGAKEFSFDDGFSCIARDQKNADRKHQNSKKVLV